MSSAGRWRWCVLRLMGAIWALCVALSGLVARPVIHAAPGTSSPPPPVSEQRGALQRPVVVKGNANLRASPSMEGSILAVATEGTVLQVLDETGSWYRVKTGEGIEAWIYKGLVLSLQLPAGPLPLEATQPAAPSSTLLSGSGPGGQPASATERPSPLPPHPSEREQVQISPPSQAMALTEQDPRVPTPSERPQRAHPVDPPSVGPSAFFQGINGYLTGGLLLVLLVTIVLHVRTSQLLKRAIREALPPPTGRWVHVRTTRQLKRARRQVGRSPSGSVPDRSAPAQVPLAPPPPDPEEPRDGERVTPSERSSQVLNMVAQPTSEIVPLSDSGVDLSPLEHAVVEAIATQDELQERELAERLGQRGFHGVLIKAVVGDLMRKTGRDRPPWVRVRYIQGHYWYTLQRRDGPGSHHHGQGDA